MLLPKPLSRWNALFNKAYYFKAINMKWISWFRVEILEKNSHFLAL
jgi:hypothetical protein